MPIRIPGLGVVIYGHRTDLQKRLKPNHKDVLLADVAPVDRPRKQDKPFIRFSAPSPYNRFPSRSDVRKALSALPQATTHAAVHVQVSNFLRTHLPAETAGPTLILVGEDHCSSASLAMLLSAMSHVRGWSSGQLLLEFAPTGREVADIRDEAAHLDRRFRTALKTGAHFPAPHNNQEANNLAYAGLFARLARFHTNAFDLARETASNLEGREHAMKVRLNHLLPNGKVSIVKVGADHLPVLHEHFSRNPNVTTLSMVEVGVPEKGDTFDVKRMSFALSTDAVLKMMPTDELADAPLDAARFIRAHGLLD